MLETQRINLARNDEINPGGYLMGWSLLTFRGTFQSSSTSVTELTAATSELFLFLPSDPNSRAR
jgi:hypothetical protein